MAVSSHQMTTSEQEPWRDLIGKIVMVTSASSESCIDLAKYSCRMITATRRIDRLMALCDEINSSEISNYHTNRNGILAVAVELDISANGSAIEVSLRKAWDAFGHIDVLINNTGIAGPYRKSLDLEEDWDRTFRTNVRGSWLLSKYVSQQMLDFNIEGSIINVSSVAGLNRMLPHGAVAYASSKSALNTMTKVMAMELGKHKIKVNSICPGLSNSEITEELMQKIWLKNVAAKTVPLRDFGTIDPALTSLVRYLIHGSTNYVTGNIFIIDSGHTLSGVPLYSSL